MSYGKTILLMITLPLVSIMVHAEEIHIFDDSIKNFYPKDICNFIERYTNECLLWNNPNYSVYKKMYDDKVVIEGDLQSLTSISDSIKFSLTRYDDKGYEAIWSDDTILLKMIFPIQYELILGKSKNILEKELQSTITNTIDIDTVVLPRLQPMADSCVFSTTPRQCYQIPEITNATYYAQYANKEYCLILDSAYIEYSLSNILSAFSEYNPTIWVNQSMYGYQIKQYHITLWQWLSYCLQENIMLYTALKEKKDDVYIMVVIAENKDLAYNHLLTFAIPHDFLTNNHKEWNMKMIGFIPTHNLKNMYKQ